MPDDPRPGSWQERARDISFRGPLNQDEEEQLELRPARHEADVRPLHPEVLPPDDAEEPRGAEAAGAGTEADAGAEPAAAAADGGILETGLEELRREAARLGREDAEAGVPEPDVTGSPESERLLVERARALFARWRAQEHRRLDELLGEIEGHVGSVQARAALTIDRFERVTNELIRLKARMAKRRWEVSEELTAEKEVRSEGLSTRLYVGAILFLGSVEFFANAPVFSALLPRDPLSQRQMQLVTESSRGWLAGAERVMAHILFRPDAALLAAGVVTFLCVLAHFFGHSLRDLVVKRDRRVRREAVAVKSPLENIIPMVLTGIGLALVLSVLFEARMTLGQVGHSQYTQDMAAVQDLRRQAALMRSDGDLLAANQKTNQADDMQQAAEDLRDYATSMSRMSFPILLLNTTLVLCALSAAYFHRRDARRERFDESPYEDERHALVDKGEGLAEQASELLADLGRSVRRMRSRVRSRTAEDWRAAGHHLEAAVALYRSENGRARGLDPRTLPAFAEPISLEVDPEEAVREMERMVSLEDHEAERDRLGQRFQEARARFLEEALAG
jgi:hypothetical protein